MRALSLARSVTVLSAVLLAGCAVLEPGRTSLAAADDALAHGRYEQALQLYDRFLVEHPHAAGAPRVRATRTVLVRLLAAQADIQRLTAAQLAHERQVNELRGTMDTLRATGEQLRLESERLRVERERLRADVERLRSIDLRDPRR